MRIRSVLPALCLAATLAPGVISAVRRMSAAAKKKVNSASDLPRFSYPVTIPPSALLTADNTTFNAFAEKVLHDVDSVLRDYAIDDKATLRKLYAARLNVQILTNENEAPSPPSHVKGLQEKPAARRQPGCSTGR